MKQLSPMLHRSDAGKVALISVLLLVPCFWNRLIQAGDLSSHIYNSWLAQQIEHGGVPGLVIVRQSTNVLFDLGLSRLYESFGAQSAQQIAVSASVLIFAWGAFALICAVNDSRPWFLMPCVAMFAYGWTFHEGLFNYYLSAGLGLWALAFAWRGGAMRLAIAGCLLVVAYAAHALGFCWAAAAIAYVLIARKASPRLGAILFAGALCAVIGLRFLITARYPTFWSPHQVLEATAIDQVWTFGLKYCGISVGLGMLWGFLFLRLSHALSVRQIAESLPFQLCCLLSAGVLLIPTRIELPAFNSALSLIAERLTLLLGILICAFLGSSKPDRWQIHSLFVLAIVYFSFLYVDTSALNRSERSVETLLSQIPPGQRVFSSFTGKDERVLLWPHAVDRACIGRCISYNNYEPRSAAFRIHAIAENPSVVWKAREYSDLSNGGYLVREEDLPLYQLQTCEPAKNSICIKALIAGEVTKGYPISLLPVLW